MHLWLVAKSMYIAVITEEGGGIGNMHIAYSRSTLPGGMISAQNDTVWFIQLAGDWWGQEVCCPSIAHACVILLTMSIVHTYTCRCCALSYPQAP
jgi:hypothetical protein